MRAALGGLTVSLLAAAAAAGVGPGEVDDRRDEEAVAAVGDTGEGVVPGGEGGQETEQAAGHDHVVVDLSLAVPEVANAQHQEGQVEEEEDEEEGDGRLEGADQQDGGENEPALEPVSVESSRVGGWSSDSPSRKDQTRHGIR